MFIADLKMTEMKKFDKNIKAWAKNAVGEKDKELAKGYRDDAKDLRRVYDLMLDGEYKKARRELEDLDTLVRDQVPNTVYNFLMDD